jgi:putative Mg2+ transporter-C (MgtC) family protein
MDINPMSRPCKRFQSGGWQVMTIWDVVLRLFVAALLGGIVGLERENKKRAAGLRTHMLVSLGSALVMVTSVFIFDQYQEITSLDPARLGAQVISGIGFLGAGTIIKQGATVKGLTTAASLWAVACIGLAVGIGFWSAAIIAAAIVFVALIFLAKLEKVMMNRNEVFPEISLKIENKPGKLGEVASFIGKTGANITNVELEHDEETTMVVHFFLKLPKGLEKCDLIASLKTIPGVSFLE